MMGDLTQSTVDAKQEKESIQLWEIPQGTQV